MRTIAIGDVHGCLKPLEKLLEAIAPASDDTLVFLGDYVDRGPDSRGVIDRLLRLSTECNTVFLRGNHDVVMQSWCEGNVDRKLWENIGGIMTLKSYGFCRPAQVPAEHYEFLRQCVNYHETDDYLFVHASYRPNLPPQKMSPECLMWTHLSWPLPRAHISGKTVVVGHTAQRMGAVADFGHIVCIDTFCFGGGNLTALDTANRTFLQVDCVGKLVRDWHNVQRRTWLNKVVNWLTMPRVGPDAPANAARARKIKAAAAGAQYRA